MLFIPYVQVWLHRSGFARFSHTRYSSDPRDIANAFVHLTNVAIQKTAENYDARSGGKLDLRSLKAGAPVLLLLGCVHADGWRKGTRGRGLGSDGMLHGMAGALTRAAALSLNLSISHSLPCLHRS